MTHICSYAIYEGGRRIGTRFEYDPSKVEELFFEKYFRWTRRGFIQWKKWKAAPKKEV